MQAGHTTPMTRKDATVQLGERPFFLVEGMDKSRLKDKLQRCENGPFRRSTFSIAHRGAPLQFPEHTKESYEAGARQGAGIVECDVTFTKDGELVCRHAECDLHTTTNIVATRAQQSSAASRGPARARRPKVLCQRSDAARVQDRCRARWMRATRPRPPPKGYLGGTASWRTDLYNSRGTLLTLRESIELNKRLGVKHTPELKSGDPQRLMTVFGGQENYAQNMIDEYKAAGVDPRDVFAAVVQQERRALLDHATSRASASQAVYLDDIDPTVNPPLPRLSLEELKQLKRQGVKIIAPPIFALLAVDANDEIVPSQYARDIKNTGFDIITWSFERADLRRGAANAGFYYLFDPTGRAVKKDSDMYKALDALAQQGRRPRHLLRLAGDRDLLRELHGAGVVPPA